MYPLFQIVDHPPSTTTVLQTQTARAVAPNHHTHCKTPVRFFHPLRVQFSRRPTPTPFHPSSLSFQRFAFRSYRWLRPPSLPSVPHGKFDQPPDCLYTFRLMTPCPISAVYQAQGIPCKTQFMPCNQRFYVAFRSYRWLRPPSLPSVPHGKFDQPPDCLYTV
jgi:hypothetical protein